MCKLIKKFASISREFQKDPFTVSHEYYSNELSSFIIANAFMIWFCLLC